jgi:serine/threonine-protein kinase
MYLKVMDFGIATSHRLDRSDAREFGGSPAYVAPEIFNGLPFDHRADLFSLGVVAYELVTGHRPFVADTLDNYASMISTACPPHPHGFSSTIHLELVAIIGRLLEKDPNKRYKSAVRVTRDLDIVLAAQYGASSAAALQRLRERPLSFQWSRAQNRRLVDWE